jgi:hypothetical protein
VTPATTGTYETVKHLIKKGGRTQPLVIYIFISSSPYYQLFNDPKIQEINFGDSKT